MAVTAMYFLFLTQVSRRPWSVKCKTQKKSCKPVSSEKSLSSGRDVFCKSVTFYISVNEGNLHQACKDPSYLCVS